MLLNENISCLNLKTHIMMHTHNIRHQVKVRAFLADTGPKQARHRILSFTTFAAAAAAAAAAASVAF